LLYIPAVPHIVFRLGSGSLWQMLLGRSHVAPAVVHTGII
jgi:hypothetical protein